MSELCNIKLVLHTTLHSPYECCSKTPPALETLFLYILSHSSCLCVGIMPNHIFNNCCLLIHGNSIGFRCEPVDAITGVQQHLVKKV